MKALHAADFEGLLAVLDPDVVVRGDAQEIRGAVNWAKGATAFSRTARFVAPALVDGAAGLVFAPRGRLLRALRFTIERGRIAEVEVIADAETAATPRPRDPLKAHMGSDCFHAGSAASRSCATCMRASQSKRRMRARAARPDPLSVSHVTVF